MRDRVRVVSDKGCAVRDSGGKKYVCDGCGLERASHTFFYTYIYYAHGVTGYILCTRCYRGYIERITEISRQRRREHRSEQCLYHGAVHGFGQRPQNVRLF